MPLLAKSRTLERPEEKAAQTDGKGKQKPKHKTFFRLRKENEKKRAEKKNSSVTGSSTVEGEDSWQAFSPSSGTQDRGYYRVGRFSACGEKSFV